jgi:hypothetical protein
MCQEKTGIKQVSMAIGNEFLKQLPVAALRVVGLEQCGLHDRIPAQKQDRRDEETKKTIEDSGDADPRARHVSALSVGASHRSSDGDGYKQPGILFAEGQPAEIELAGEYLERLSDG